MFGGKKKKCDLPIGIDVGDSGVRMLQLSICGDAVLARAAAFEPFPGDLKVGTDTYTKALSAAIQSAYSRGEFTGNRVVSALPVSAMQCKNLRLPMMPADELDSAVQWEAADRFRMGEGQCSLQYMHAGQVNQGDEIRQELILLATPLGLVEDHVKVLTQNNLRPIAIDSVPSALARLSVMRDALQSTPTLDTAVNVMIDVGQSSTKVLIALDGQVRFYKTIEIGGAHLDSVLSGTLSLSLDDACELRRSLKSFSVESVANKSEMSEQYVSVLEALQPTLKDLSREIGLCLRYYGVTFRGSRPTHAELVGGAATVWLAAALGDTSGLKLNLNAPLGDIDLAAVRSEIRPGGEGAWAVAAGLSIREHMKYFKRAPVISESEEDSVFDDSNQSKGVAA